MISYGSRQQSILKDDLGQYRLCEIRSTHFHKTENRKSIAGEFSQRSTNENDFFYAKNAIQPMGPSIKTLMLHVTCCFKYCPKYLLWVVNGKKTIIIFSTRLIRRVVNAYYLCIELVKPNISL